MAHVVANVATPRMPAGASQRGGMASDLRCQHKLDIDPPRAFLLSFSMRAASSHYRRPLVLLVRLGTRRNTIFVSVKHKARLLFGKLEL